ncbi:PASTA domain-containing protein [Serinicoccus sp. CNJ-927]|uniref:PASTA domain-containing protein n=1 Tax=Serinicoccus sp. CNJ-927 TaxID=1904970 RepID=UPI00117ADD15|nr:PASTA domain-containing protein [Serinicoccus sp. CNJ-927]
MSERSGANSGAVAWVVAVATLLGVAIALLTYLGLTPESGDAQSPTHIAQSTPHATGADADRDVGVPETAAATQVTPPNADPGGASHTPDEAPVALMPNVTGTHWNVAKEKIADLQYDLEESFEPRNVRDGTVVAQVPRAGEQVTVPVNITVARKYVTVEASELTQSDNFRFSGPSLYSVDGTQYRNSFKVFSQYPSASMEWDLSRDFDYVEGLIGLSDEHAESGTAVSVEFRTDGQAVRTESTSLGSPIRIREPVHDAHRLEVVVNTTSGTAAHLVLADFRFLAKPTPP